MRAECRVILLVFFHIFCIAIWTKTILLRGAISSNYTLDVIVQSYLRSTSERNHFKWQVESVLVKDTFHLKSLNPREILNEFPEEHDKTTIFHIVFCQYVLPESNKVSLYITSRLPQGLSTLKRKWPMPDEEGVCVCVCEQDVGYFCVELHSAFQCITPALC